MKIISKTIKLLPIFLLVLGLSGCSDDDDGIVVVPPNEQSIVDIALGNPNLTSLVAALQAADGDLVNLLSGDGPFTVLAPTNDAFDTFLAGTPLDQVDTALLEQILRNHVISGNITAATLAGLSDAQGKGYASTSADGPGGRNLSLLFDTSGTLPLFNNSANVVSADLADIDASNGVIHVIDAVLDLPDIVDHAINNDNFTSLTQALTDEGLVPTLQMPGPYTVFAPTNDAFGNFTNPNTNALSEILKNHVLSGLVFASDLGEADYVKTLAEGPMDLNMNGTNLDLYYNTTNGVILNGGPEVVATDIVGTNGVIHVIDNVIDIPTVVTFALADPNFASLVAALSEADGSDADPMYIPTLQTAGPFTVFAPNNNAFDTLLDGATVADLDDALLNSVLAHHVSTLGNALSTDLTPDGTTNIPTLVGQDIVITLPGTSGNIADVEDGAGNSDIGIIAVDVQAGNGVIHVLNKVLLPSGD
ncbi:MAG: fasciclin domain-containing protein [Bacteroidota bacterium]